MNEIPRILLAEDNDNDVELTLNALKDANLANRVDVVRDGVEAMDYLLYRGKYESRKRENPIVVMLDIKMPRMDGLQVLKNIKENPELKNIPVVMLTSSSLDKDIIESYSSGVNAYVVKPIDFAEFQTAVNHLGVFWALINKIPN
ncbi:MAG: response regulator [Bacteroidales bacterium]|nr:response regulator [Bacteroidales bacterium]